MHFHGDAAAVVNNFHSPVFQQCDVDFGGVACHGFINGVVDDLPHKVVEAAFTGGANVHTWAFAYCLKAFKDSDRRCVIMVLCGRHVMQHS